MNHNHAFDAIELNSLSILLQCRTNKKVMLWFLDVCHLDNDGQGNVHANLILLGEIRARYCDFRPFHIFNRAVQRRVKKVMLQLQDGVVDCILSEDIIHVVEIRRLRP